MIVYKKSNQTERNICAENLFSISVMFACMNNKLSCPLRKIGRFEAKQKSETIENIEEHTKPLTT